MACPFEVRIPAHTPGGIPLVELALDVIDRLESQLTIYRDDSELSRLNARAHLGPVEVEEQLFSLLREALAITQATRGAYDVTSGALSLAWGFVRGPRRVPPQDELTEALARSGARHVTLDSQRRTITFDRPGIVINLGSIGKGYAIDRATDIIRDYWWPTSALLHGGQSSLYALGSPPDNFGGRWPIALADPTGGSEPLAILHLRNRGLGTSGASIQQFEADGRRYGHIIDPRTGIPPAAGPLQVTVLAPTAAQADAVSTALYLLDQDEAIAWLAARPELAAIYVQNHPAGGLRLLAIGLGPEEISLATAREIRHV